MPRDLTPPLDTVESKNLRDLAVELRRAVVPLDDARFRLLKLGFTREAAEAVALWLGELDRDGWTVPQVTLLVESVAAERARFEHARDDIQLVWTGPDLLGAESRDSARALEELFAAATETVLMAGYNFRPGAHFEALARAARAQPALRVEVFAHVFTDRHATVSDALDAHDRSLRAALRDVPPRQVTAYRPSPALLEETREGRFHLHAKCVVVDARRVLVTSANFSYTAQEKNVEAGVALDDRRLAARLRAQFDALVKRGDMVAHAL